TSVRVQAEAEADVGAVVLGEDRAARVAVEDGGRRRGVAVGVGLELDVERLVAVRGIRRRAPAGEVRTRHRGRLWAARRALARALRRADELERVQVARGPSRGAGAAGAHADPRPPRAPAGPGLALPGAAA